MELIEISKELQTEFPEKTIVDISEFEDENHNSYKFLFEQNDEQCRNLREEVAALSFENQSNDHYIADLKLEIEDLQTQLNNRNNELLQSLDVFKHYLEQGIFVSNVEITSVKKNDLRQIGANQSDENKNNILKENISTKPGVYQGKRPSWYTSLKHELSPENIKRKNTENTIEVLKNKLLFWKSTKDLSIEQAEDNYDKKRKQEIISLLDSKCSNEEKYLKYILLSPGIDKEYIKTLQGASELNINANLIIALLEQPNDQYNREIIELYVSQVQKNNEYNLKQELAQELIEGKWFITAEINGVVQNFQLVPIDEINQIHDSINAIKQYFEDSNANGNQEKTSGISIEFNDDYLNNVQ